jgi:hypothetical protein
MADDNETYRRLAEAFYRPSTLESLLQGFHAIDSHLATKEISSDQASQLRAFAFRSMRGMAAGDSLQSRNVLLDLLLPYCLAKSSDPEDEGSIARYRYRECLRDWLDDLPEQSRSEIRKEVLQVISKSLKSFDSEEACWVISVIGYRAPDISDALWMLVKADDGESGDIALATLSELGFPSEERRELILQVCDRARLRCTTTLVKTMWGLADPGCFDTIERYWLKSADETVWAQLSYFIIRAIAEILIVRPNMPDLHDHIWSRMLSLYSEAPIRLGTTIHLDDYLAPYCDNPQVVPFILNGLLDRAGDAEQFRNERYMIYHRLEDCIQPRQLEGWLCPLDPGICDTILKDASQNTGKPSRFVSTSMRLKESACRTLLCLSEAKLTTPEMFEELVGKETSPYARETISDLLACLRIDPIPATAVRWVTERVDVGKHDLGDELLYRAAACQILRSASTREAFEALSVFGHTLDGTVLHRTLDALVDVAVHLTLRNDRSIADAVVQTVLHDSERHHRVAAAGVMMHMASLGQIDSHHGSDLADLITDSDRDDYERSRIVATLGYLSDDVLTSQVESQLVEWSRGRSILASRSLEALSRHDRLATHEELLVDRLGLRPLKEGWVLEPGSKDVGASGYILSLLFAKHPSAFIMAVCTFIETRDWVESAQLVHSLDNFYFGSEPHPVHPEVVNALVERIRLRQSRSSADLELFGFLGKWSPDSLALRPWEQVWDNWMPDARVALADALGECVQYKGAARVRATDLLLSLTGEGTYAVRRSAYRALSRLDCDSLKSFCAACSESSSWELRRRGAEGCGWLIATDDYDAAFQRVAVDPEGPVRSAAKRAEVERRERLLGERYLQVILKCRNGTNEEILLNWKYGHALQRVGDDSCIQKLVGHVRRELLPSNVRHWLNMVRKGMEKRWREITQKWPEPWLSWQGTIEEGQGLIRGEGIEISVRYTLWKQPAPTPSEHSMWGGAAFSSEFFSLFSLKLDEAELVLSNGQRGMIVISTLMTGQLRFLGNGPYPT